MVSSESPGLPFLIVHGWWIGKLLVVAAGVAGIAVPRWWRQRRERAAIASELRARAATDGTLALGHSCLRGTLRGRVRSLAIGGGASGHWWSARSDELAIEIGGERVVLHGTVDVVRGTQAVAGGRRLLRNTPPAIAKQADRPFGRYRSFALDDGDEVIVQGRLSRRARHEPTGYRESAGEWVFEPYDVHASITAMAARPAVCPVPLGPVRGAMYAAFAAVAWYLVLWGAGAALVARASDQARRSHSEDRVSFGTLELASALPHVRASALDELAKELGDWAPRTDKVMRLRFALEDLRAGCRAMVALELVEERYDDALAAGCGSVDQRLDALVRLGRYDDAATLARRDRSASSALRVLASIGAGHWAEAAALVKSDADRLAHDRDPVARYESEAREDCLATWLRAKAGDPTAQPTASIDVCQILNALVLAQPARHNALSVIADRLDDGEDALLARSLAWADGAYQFGRGDIGLDDEVVALNDGRVRDVRMWFASRALTAPSRFPDPEDQAVAHAERAGLETFRGDFSGAQRDVTEAVRIATGTQLTPDLDHLVDEIAVHAGTSTTAAPSAALSSGRCAGGTLEDALHAASAGDGLPLARALERCELHWSDAGLILAVLPKVQHGRAELAEALRWYHDNHTGEFEAASGLYSEPSDSPKPAFDEVPFRVLADAVTRRDLAQLVGDHDGATRWQTIIDRQLDVLADTDTLVAFLAWARD
jgi:hypothetical protein